MKIALYIEDGLEQIVLTPESDTEEAILGKLHDGSRALDIKRGSFFRCRGGWMRYGIYSPADYGMYGPRDAENDESTMIVLRHASCDEHPKGEDPKGLSGEAMPARSAEGGDAQNPTESAA